MYPFLTYVRVLFYKPLCHLFFPLLCEAVTPSHLFSVELQSHSQRGWARISPSPLKLPSCKNVQKRIAFASHTLCTSLKKNIEHILFPTPFYFKKKPSLSPYPSLVSCPACHAVNQNRIMTENRHQRYSLPTPLSHVPPSAADDHLFFFLLPHQSAILLFHSGWFCSSDDPPGQSCQKATTPRTTRTTNPTGTPRSRTSNVHLDAVYMLTFVLLTMVAFSNVISLTSSILYSFNCQGWAALTPSYLSLHNRQV